MPSILPEVEQYILLESRAVLRSCSLVCSRFCYWAQSRLLGSIIVDYSSNQRDDCSSSLWINRMRRLAGVLKDSPPLSPTMPSIPPEVEQYILLQHLQSRTALRSCSLVCSRFCYWAQSRLFESIVVGFNERDDCSPSPWISRMRRLAGVLEDSSHLALVVRCVKVRQTTADILTIIAAMSLPNLHTLKLKGIPRSDDVLQSFRTIVSGSSLRTLQLAFQQFPGNATDFSAFAAVLPSSLVSLDILWCREPSVDPWVAAGLPCACLPPYSPIIQRLRLDRSPGAVALLNSPACPIDLSSIQHLDYSYSVHPALSSLLQHLGRTVDSITLGPGEKLLSDSDFHMLPGLVHINCWLTVGLVPDVIERLPVANCIRSLRVRTYHDLWQDASIRPEWDMEQLGSDFEDAILRRLPDLTTVMVEVEILLAPGRPNRPIFDATAVAAAIRKSMPRLSSTLILSVGYVYDEFFKIQQRV